MEKVEERLLCIEEKLDKLLPLVDLLDHIIRANINRTDELKNNFDIEDETFKHLGRDLVYTVKEDFIYIYGTKTYQLRELIKSSLTDASWCKEKQAWKSTVFNNCDSYITNIFQNISKDL